MYRGLCLRSKEVEFFRIASSQHTPQMSSSRPLDFDSALFPSHPSRSEDAQSYLISVSYLELQPGWGDRLIILLDRLSIANERESTIQTLRRIEKVLGACGPRICEILIKHPVLRRCAPDLVQRLMGKTTSTGEGRMAATSTSLSPLMLLNNPLIFKAETDSRNNFKSAALKVLFDNRERVRDAFLNELNLVINSQHKFDSWDDRICENDGGLGDRLRRECGALLYVENSSWFAKFFVQNLIAKAVPKMSKLDQRIFSRTDSSLMDIGPLTYGTLVEIFPRPEERFFAFFVWCTNNYSLTTHIKQCCAAQLLEFSSAPQGSAAMVSTDATSFSLPENWFSERSSICNVLAKFLGFISYYPKFAPSQVAAENKATSVAFETLHNDALDESNLVGPLGTIDIRSILATATVDWNLSLVVPWCVRFLRAGPLMDRDIGESNYMHEVRIMLGLIRRSRRIKDLVTQKENLAYLRCAVEIDHLASESGLTLDPQVNPAMYRAIKNRYVEFYKHLDDDKPSPNEASRLAIDALPNLLDGSNLDNIPTTVCVPLEQLRIALTIIVNKAHANSSSNDLMLLCASSSQSLSPSYQTTSLVASPGPSATSPIWNRKRQTLTFDFVALAPTTANHSEMERKLILAALSSLLVQHDVNVQRVLDFAANNSPSLNVIINEFAPEAVKLALDRTLLGERDDQVVLNCFMNRSFYPAREYVTRLIQLACPDRDADFQSVVIDLGVERLELATEKIMRRKIVEAIESSMTATTRVTASSSVSICRPSSAFRDRFDE